MRGRGDLQARRLVAARDELGPVLVDLGLYTLDLGGPKMREARLGAEELLDRQRLLRLVGEPVPALDDLEERPEAALDGGVEDPRPEPRLVSPADAGSR